MAGVEALDFDSPDETDAWVLGDERFVGFEFEARSAEEYATP
jgi:hypothetical protein